MAEAVAPLAPADLALMSDKEKDLLRATSPDALAHLSDEDTLDALHKRVRRARTKYVKNYRRQAAGQVVKKGARGKAQPNSERTIRKAEIFEDALARVSRRMADVADEIAVQLRTARIGTASAAKEAAAQASAAGRGQTLPKKRIVPPRSARSGPGSLVAVAAPPGIATARTKKVAATRATNARRQAKRDAR